MPRCLLKGSRWRGRRRRVIWRRRARARAGFCAKSGRAARVGRWGEKDCDAGGGGGFHGIGRVSKTDDEPAVRAGFRLAPSLRRRTGDGQSFAGVAGPAGTAGGTKEVGGGAVRTSRGRRWGHRSIASRLALNSVPDFHSGHFDVLATSRPSSKKRRVSVAAPSKSHHGLISSLTLW